MLSNWIDESKPTCMRSCRSRSSICCWSNSTCRLHSSKWLSRRCTASCRSVISCTSQHTIDNSHGCSCQYAALHERMLTKSCTITRSNLNWALHSQVTLIAHMFDAGIRSAILEQRALLLAQTVTSRAVLTNE